jgi:heme exporter protein B
MGGFIATLARDLAIARREGGEALLAVLFFVLGAMLFPLGVGPEARLLAAVAAGLIWVMALLATLLALDRLFQADWRDGALELMVVSPESLTLIVAAKCCAHWLVTGLPMALAAPLMALLLNLPVEGWPTLVAALLLGGPALSFIGAVCAALIVGARRGGVLMTLLALPLYIPTLIFGAGAVQAAVGGFDASSHLALMAATTLASMALCPWAAAAALRHAVE